MVPVMFTSKEDMEGGEANEEIGSDVAGGERGRTLVFVGAFGLVEGEDNLDI